MGSALFVLVCTGTLTARVRVAVAASAGEALQGAALLAAVAREK